MKLDITTVDKNFLNGTQIDQSDIIWRDILENPFEIRGLAVHENEYFHRVPLEVASKVSDGVKLLSTHTAGGRVRFRTDSKRICVRCESLYEGSMTHMPVTGSAGADVYINGIFSAIIRPANDKGGMFDGSLTTDGQMNSIEINLPLYNGIKRMYIGLIEGSTALEPVSYRIDKPIVYYGSSITQGGCASRPGNTYQGFVSRWLDSDHINLGFSGNARGETVMAKYISGLEMSAFVLDYDHNASNAEWLKNTHESFYNIIRENKPDLPILMISKPDCDRAPEDAKARREVIINTYENAIRKGDRLVAFLDGAKLFAEKERDACTVDGCHPNDLGFYRMAQAIYAELIKFEL